MPKANVLSCSLVLCLIGLLPVRRDQIPDVGLYREGLNIPDIRKLVHVRNGTLGIPGIEVEIKTERWELPKGSPYRITAFYPWQSGPVSEEVGWLVIYRAPNDKILCYEYGRFLRDKESGREIGGTLSFIADLDNNGIYESQFDSDGEKNDELLIASIVRLKLGISEETNLVIGIIKAAFELENAKLRKKSML